MSAAGVGSNEGQPRGAVSMDKGSVVGSAWSGAHSRGGGGRGQGRVPLRGED